MSDESGVLNIKVCDHNGQVTVFKVKKNLPIQKVMQTFCERKNLKFDECRFRRDGEKLEFENENGQLHTPETLGMENDDSIDVFQEQVGGSSSQQIK